MKKLLSALLIAWLVLSAGIFCHAAEDEARAAADRLYGLGLFSGTGIASDGSPVYSLDRGLTRQEAITMVLSLMGKTREARETVFQTHFLDVDAWAVPYVGYAFRQGITAGTGPDSFGAHKEVTAAEYLTFLLRCLGYENGNDFRWDEAASKTDWLGVTRGEYENAQRFTRADAVVCSERALHAFCRGSEQTLSEKVLGLALDAPLSLPARVADNTYAFRLEDVPTYEGTPFVVLNAGIPSFTEDDLSHLSFERYGEMDGLGRCTAALACLHRDLMPSDSRHSIWQIRPSGWHTVRYDDLIADRYLYNRCHLVAFSLAGEQDNERNLITGTYGMNHDGMRGFETRVANFLQHSDCHVLYRSTPVFDGQDLVARGVHLEAMSVEDGGEGILLNVFCYNVQPGIEIDYRTGDSRAMENAAQIIESRQAVVSDAVYVANTKTGKFHYTWCSAAAAMSELNRYYSNDRDELIELFEPCRICNP
ncbi:MAG: DNA/RNA non-specific endonuclease [Clostridia bacterium]|nr:DNA/RNA non-specific endonuclease [Clostridia bacterium]